MTNIAGGQSNVNIATTNIHNNHSITGDYRRGKNILFIVTAKVSPLMPLIHKLVERPHTTSLSLPLSDAEVYARQLLLKRHGYPLWYPEPYGYSVVYRTKGVRIGDVGYVCYPGRRF